MSETRFRLRDGTVIDVTVRGRGPALMLLHGWTAAAGDWAPILGQLTERFRCIVWNARPHAATDDPGIDSVAEDLAELREDFTVRRWRWWRAAGCR